ncbi:MAG TPA: DUF1801 domain-containing protein [Phycisphaerales bacterium]|nr:DUF1801 domain-containing protein [Phycisphaerales bacterium]
MAKKASVKKKTPTTKKKAASEPRAKPASRERMSKQYTTRADLNAPVSVAIDAMVLPHRETAKALDALIRACAGKRDVVSQVKWGNATYRISDADLFAIAASKQHVSLYVGNGAKLEGPFTAILEGAGKLMRHVKCRMTDDASRPQVRAVIEAAIALAANQSSTAWTKK